MIAIEAIVAMSENRVIGRDGHLPWTKIPSDMEHFRRMTMGQVVVMGRKSCESLPNPLGGRYLIGVSRTQRRIPFVNEVVPTYEHALVAAIRRAVNSPPPDREARIMIAGGETAYRWALDNQILSAVNLTVVEGNYVGGQMMPKFENDFLEFIEDDENDAYAAYRKVQIGATFKRFVRRRLVDQYLLTRRYREREVTKPGANQPNI